jgi:hypothetical protein
MERGCKSISCKSPHNCGSHTRNYSTEARNFQVQDTWFTYEGYEFLELARQEYGGNNCFFAIGLVDGHAVDTHYLWITKDGEPATVLLLRADEVAAIAWLCSGALWSRLIGEL